MDSGAAGAGLVAVDGRLCASGDVVNTGPREGLGVGVVRSGIGGSGKRGRFMTVKISNREERNHPG